MRIDDCNHSTGASDLLDGVQIDEEVREKWVAALRSGQYRQSFGYLRTENGYCCLGVLCDLHDPDGWSRTEESGPLASWYTFAGGDLRDSLIPEYAFNAWAGMSSELLASWVVSALTSANDCRDSSGEAYHSFDDIADWIEEHL